jgi:phosphoesterase RecJ-like protein
MFALTGATPSMTDGFINFARGIRGGEVAVMFREQIGGWKLSFRSRGQVNVADIASKLGGGGHHNAAGAFLAGSYHRVKESVCRSVESVLKKS